MADLISLPHSEVTQLIENLKKVTDEELSRSETWLRVSLLLLRQEKHDREEARSLRPPPDIE